jgi:hypothetical protein
MPRSIVIYSSKDTFVELKAALNETFGDVSVKPYTLSFAQPTGSGLHRIRITELVDGAVAPIIAKVGQQGSPTIAASTDKDVRAMSYEELMEDADRARRVVALQFISPTMLPVGGRSVPFPVLSTLFDGYGSYWEAFSHMPVTGLEAMLDHLCVTDFRISCSPTEYGVGFEGRLAMELDKGRTEKEIALFNVLSDFSFFCGSGVHTHCGLGQTKRLPG